MSGKRYRTISQFRAEIGTGVSLFQSEWLDEEHRVLYESGALTRYNDVEDEHGRPAADRECNHRNFG